MVDRSPTAYCKSCANCRCHGIIFPIEKAADHSRSCKAEDEIPQPCIERKEHNSFSPYIHVRMSRGDMASVKPPSHLCRIIMMDELDGNSTRAITDKICTSHEHWSQLHPLEARNSLVLCMVSCIPGGRGTGNPEEFSSGGGGSSK